MAEIDRRIRPSDPQSIEAWADRLDVSESQLRSAIHQVGTWAPAVERFVNAGRRGAWQAEDITRSVRTAG